MRPMEITRHGPIVMPDTHPAAGTNINGPSLLRVPDWVEGALGWTRLVGDAGDSPVVQDRDSGTVSVKLIRTFDWRW